MAIRTKYSAYDMIRMANFARENPSIKPLPLIKAYNKKYPEISEEQKLKNLRRLLSEDNLFIK
jgi:hypothetical protein